MPVCNLCQAGHAFACDSLTLCLHLKLPVAHARSREGAILGSNYYSPSSKRVDKAILPSHAHYIHAPVPLPPEKANKLPQTMGCFDPRELANASHTSRQSACNYSKQCILSGLMHPHGGACVQSVASRTPICTSHYLLGGRTGCTMRCFAAWEAGIASHMLR